MKHKEDRIYGTVPPDLQLIANVVKLMESSIRIPFTNRTIGLEPIIGLIPVLGDMVGFIISGWIMVSLLRNGASGKVTAKMFLNLGIDTLLMFVPIAGNVADFFFKANQRNLVLAIEHYKYGKNQGSAWPVLIPVIGVLVLMFIILVGGSIWLLILLIQWLQTVQF